MGAIWIFTVTGDSALLLQQIQRGTDLCRLFMAGKAGEHLRQQLLRALGVAGFGERPCGEEVIVDELRMVGMLLREAACQRQHHRVMLLPRGASG